MAELRAFEQIDAGGVDSRSNPINMPRNRALRCLNWCPKQAGFWELRWGYSTVTMSTVTASAIHSMFPYRTWNGHKYVLFMQGTTLSVLDTATGTVTVPAVDGSPVSSATPGEGFFANNRFHYGNGADQKFFDSSVWRDSGLPSPTDLSSTLLRGIGLVEGVRELTTTQASSVTLTPAAGGTFVGDVFSGRLMYVAIFDTQYNEIGPATIFVGSGRVVLTAGQKVTVGSLPSLAAVNTNWVKLIGGTIDGGNFAYFYTNTSTVITAIAAAFNPTTVTSAAHGLSTGDVVGLSGTNGFDGIYSVVNVVDANNFQINIDMSTSPPPSGSTGTVQRIVQAGNAAVTVDVLNPSQYALYQTNQNRGLAASTIGSTNAGYQFAFALYNPNTGHVGNYEFVSGRALQSAYRSNWRIVGLPTLVSTGNSEVQMLIGRTGDGASIPYPITDNAGNWFTSPNNNLPSFGFVTDPNLDPNRSMPTRNGIIPSQCNMFCVAGDYCYAGDTGSPYVRRSGSLADALSGVFCGRPEQSWAGNDLDTFPTGEALTGMFEIDQEVFCGTLHDSALSVNLSGIQQWTGPFAVGIAGKRAGCKCGSHGFYWVTGDKQLATFSQGVPLPVSDEYELAELSQIGDQYLSTVEVSYYRDPSKNKDEIRIEGQKADGTPYTIIHDFKLIEVYTPPGSMYGQGYSAQFAGELAAPFHIAQIRDANSRLQIYAGGQNGQIYQLYSGADDAGSQYTADTILLLNGGADRPSVPFVDFYGDQNIQITVGRNLQTSLSPGSEWGFDPPNDGDADQPQSVPGAEQDFLYRFFLNPPEVQRLYLRFQLTSHSADGNLNLNSPPHVPLENYGRLYEFIPSIGDERSR